MIITVSATSDTRGGYSPHIFSTELRGQYKGTAPEIKRTKQSVGRILSSRSSYRVSSNIPPISDVDITLQ